MNMDFGGMFDGMFRPLQKGCCKIGMNGKVAVKTSGGYKTFDVKTKRLTNCSQFAFDVDGAFWTVPTVKVQRGDIILVNGRPSCVIETEKETGDGSIKAFSYEDSTIATIVPEHHVFMGKTYCYAKIFSPFMNMCKDNGSMQDIMKMMMMSQLFRGNTGSTNDSNMMNGFNPMLFMMLGGSGNNPFEGMFEDAFNFGIMEEDEMEEGAE